MIFGDTCEELELSSFYSRQRRDTFSSAFWSTQLQSHSLQGHQKTHQMSLCQYANEHNFELEQVFFHVGQLDYEHPDDVLLQFLRGLQSSRSRIVIAETRDYFPESQMRFIPPTQACFLREHIQQMKVGSRQHPLPAEKRNLSGKPYLYSKEKTRWNLMSFDISKEIEKNLSQTAGLGYRHAAALNQLRAKLTWKSTAAS